MEHEVVVQLPAATVQEALRDQELLSRCVPGLTTDEEPGGVGRLRLRIGGSTITYRGELSLIEGREGVLTVLAEGQEARGSGEVTATVRLSVRPGPGTEPGADPEGAPASCTLRFTGDLSATGRLTEFDSATLAATGRRLLDRFAADLAAELSGAEPPEATVVYLEDHAGGFSADLDDDLSDLIAFSDDLPEEATPVERPEQPEPELHPVPEPALEYLTDPAATGPVRRSIVGRSAEEVDHAPPRGRYAPALPARSARARAATRWGGPEAVAPADRSPLPWVIGGGAVLLGGAVVLVRALRRR
ncbi:carbon monoxide dehydrogenase subunit G [Kitasatospora sp. NPDC096147]|uniref:carbon monoxide dehydrogenase subunit G n=1 Tax=Kitasatospora sp. NPDC096147 TaxID=3364093 RepID=UPI0038228385